jgi:hypothetical protein
MGLGEVEAKPSWEGSGDANGDVACVRMQIYVPGVMSVAGKARGDLNLDLSDVKIIISWKSVGIIILVVKVGGISFNIH